MSWLEVVVLSSSDVDSVVMRLRGAAGVVDVDLRGLSASGFEGVQPWRTFRWTHGQAHYSGLYWSAVMGDHVGYESRLELSWLLLADRDRRVRRIVSQPFQLVAVVGGKVRRHVPDFVRVGDDGLVTVVDVKPLRRVSDEVVAFTFAWTEQVVRRQGWVFEVFSEPDPVLLANVRFLSGYRRARHFDERVMDVVLQAAALAAVFAEAEAGAVAVVGDRGLVRAHLLHALWSGRLHADLCQPLRETTPLAVA